MVLEWSATVNLGAVNCCFFCQAPWDISLAFLPRIDRGEFPRFCRSADWRLPQSSGAEGNLPFSDVPDHLHPCHRLPPGASPCTLKQWVPSGSLSHNCLTWPLRLSTKRFS